MATFERVTKETRVTAEIRRDGAGEARVHLAGAFAGSEPGRGDAAKPGATGTGVTAFTGHVLTALAAWSGFSLRVHAESLDGLEHHLVEDAAITLGRALRKEIDAGRVERVGNATVPMDDAVVQVAVDVVERPYYEGPLPDPLMDHVLRSLATEAGLTLHVLVLRGRDPHHVVEAAFKAFGIALKRATTPRADRLSTKGGVTLTEEG